jgi:hypothetical protein
MRRLIQATGIRTGHGSACLAISAETGAGNFALPGDAQPSIFRFALRSAASRWALAQDRRPSRVSDGTGTVFRGAERRPGVRHLLALELTGASIARSP